MNKNKANYVDLANKVVLISGGATGIGKSLVEAFARQGAKTAFIDIAAMEGEVLAKALEKEGCEVMFKCGDITDLKAYQSYLLEVADEYGPITVLLNNAANDVRHSLDGLSFERFDELLAVNLKHAMYAIQAVVPMMRKAGNGSIINFGSVGWMMANTGYPVYAASKAAVHGMTRGLAREMGQQGIRINTLVPGWVMTEKQLELVVDEASKEMIKTRQCMAGPLLAEDVAQMALFLASDVSAMCTSQNFIVDGGWV